ncbi:hypothetical protein DdX_09637 [Ditylenchus destructor]|uniref:Uncharacterized protein n=1 Tax=Ditylenchus destructor TaxID=166010 RepID=A0AAD4N0F3_9BILA|nr:hypothetical protein DdX_09637 [Ditylenchus destructor]
MQTNYTTLADEVDGFLIQLQTKISKLRDAIEIPLLTDRQQTFGMTKDEIRQLFNEYYAILVGHRAIKREDERMKELSEAIVEGYTIIIQLANMAPPLGIAGCNKRTLQAVLFFLSERNIRLKRLKKQSSTFYMATLICITVELSLNMTYLSSQYYTGSCLIFEEIVRGRKNEQGGGNYLEKPFNDYPVVATTLQTILDEHLAKLNKSMQSPILEVRQLRWEYEEDAMNAACRHHLSLKQYHVDQSTMPRQIGDAHYNALHTLSPCFAFYAFMLSIRFFLMHKSCSRQS